jgi:hypothetical protein
MRPSSEVERVDWRDVAVYFVHEVHTVHSLPRDPESELPNTG